MNTLKKTLMKDDPKKYQKSRIQISGIKRTSNWHDIDSMMEKKMQKRISQENVQESYKKIIQNSFINGDLKDPTKLYKELKQKYHQLHINEQGSDDFLKIIDILKKMAESEQGAVFKKYISLSREKIQSLAREKKMKQNQKNLQEYNKLIKTVKPNFKVEEEKAQGVERALKKLVHSTSAANLKIRVTRQEYQFEEDDNPLRKKKSLDLKSKSKVKSTSNKNLQGTNKLQAFLKDTNVKLVKTKIQYDYSAIFEASKTNIQQRNKTTYIEPKNQKQVLNKASKGKKDQAFVFYRPQKKQ